MTLIFETQEQWRRELRGRTIFVLDLLTSEEGGEIWHPVTAAMVRCPECGATYATPQEDSLSGWALEWMPASSEGEYVLLCRCGKCFPTEDWLADVGEEVLT